MLKMKNENCTILIPKGNSYCLRESSARGPRFKVSSEGLSAILLNLGLQSARNQRKKEWIVSIFVPLRHVFVCAVYHMINLGAFWVKLPAIIQAHQWRHNQYGDSRIKTTPRKCRNIRQVGKIFRLTFYGKQLRQYQAKCCCRRILP